MTSQPHNQIKLLPLFLILLILPFCNIKAQVTKRVLTLDDVIEIAQRQSPDALASVHRFKSSYWLYSNYKASLMPMLTLQGTIPSLSKSIERVATPEGEVFYRSNQATYLGELSLSKKIGLTGGQISLFSDLNRIDHFARMQGDSVFTTYQASPLNIQIIQPLFGYNENRWLKKIEPLRYNEAERRYIEQREQINISASNAFFLLLEAQIRLKIAEINLANNDTLYQIARGRYNIGTIAENELLQIELSLLNARTAFDEAGIQVKLRTFELKSFLRLPEDSEVELIPPYAPPVNLIEEKLAVDKAHQNRADILAFDRRILEVESRVNEARANRRFSANLSATYGLTQYTTDFGMVYKDPDEMQMLNIGLVIPILDWGKAKSAIKMAESDRELERTSVQQDIVDFDQEIMIQVMQYNLQKSQFAIASKSDTVAQKRYEVTKQRYLIGKIGITDLNIAQAEKDNARQGYVAALYSYWQSYYELRRLTHYDFLKGEEIMFDINDIPDLE